MDDFVERNFEVLFVPDVPVQNVTVQNEGQNLCKCKSGDEGSWSYFQVIRGVSELSLSLLAGGTTYTYYYSK